MISCKYVLLDYFRSFFTDSRQMIGDEDRLKIGSYPAVLFYPKLDSGS